MSPAQWNKLLLTQSATHSTGVVSYPANMAGFASKPRAAITPIEHDTVIRKKFNDSKKHFALTVNKTH